MNNTSGVTCAAGDIPSHAAVFNRSSHSRQQRQTVGEAFHMHTAQHCKERREEHYELPRRPWVEAEWD